MNHIATIAAASIREHSRRKLLLVFAGTAVVLTLPMIYFALRSSDREIFFSSTRSLALALSQGFMKNVAMVAALTVAMGNVGQAFASGEASQVLVRPVARWQYVLGRYLGSAAVICGLCAFMALLLQGLSLLDGAGFSVLMLTEWYVLAINFCILAALTTFVSTFISVAPAAAVVTFFGYIAVGLVAFMHELTSRMAFGGFLSTASKVTWYLMPKFLSSPIDLNQAAEMRRNMGTGSPVISAATAVPPNTLGLFFWALGYLVLILAVSIWITNRKEVK